MRAARVAFGPSAARVTIATDAVLHDHVAAVDMDLEPVAARDADRAATGGSTLTTITTLTPAYAAPNAVAYGSHEAVTHDGSMFLLDPPTDAGTYPYPPTGFSALYRITPTARS